MCVCRFYKYRFFVPHTRCKLKKMSVSFSTEPKYKVCVADILTELCEWASSYINSATAKDLSDSDTVYFNDIITKTKHMRSGVLTSKEFGSLYRKILQSVLMNWVDMKKEKTSNLTSHVQVVVYIDTDQVEIYEEQDREKFRVLVNQVFETYGDVSKYAKYTFSEDNEFLNSIFEV